MVLLEWMEQFALQFGLFGVFLVSFVGAISIIFPVPYTLVIYFIGAFMDPFFVAIVAGLGSALGEFSGYILGYYGRAVLSETRQKKMDYMMKVFNHFGVFAIFIFALTPLPDDLLFIPLGIMRYPFVKAFVPALMGKILMSFIVAYGGRVSANIIGVVFGDGGLLGIVVVSAFLILLMVAILKIDWEKVFEKYIGVDANNNELS